MSTPNIPPVPPADSHSESVPSGNKHHGAVPPPIPSDETVIDTPGSAPELPRPDITEETIVVNIANVETAHTGSVPPPIPSVETVIATPGSAPELPRPDITEETIVVNIADVETAHTGSVPPPVPSDETVVVTPADASDISETIIVKENFIPEPETDTTEPVSGDIAAGTPMIAPVMPPKKTHTQGISAKTAALISNIIAAICVAGCLAAALWCGWLLYDNFKSFREPSELAKEKKGETLVVAGPQSAPDAITIETVLDNAGDTDGYILRLGSAYMPIKRPTALINGQDNGYSEEIEPLYDSEVSITYNGNKGYLTYDGKKVPLTFVKQ
ncbi:MAG: hypothetical protein K2M79_02795 [Muribaculaceae bacterium]|nr:hypothetical protein [Muribaculaceae bacterium]